MPNKTTLKSSQKQTNEKENIKEGKWISTEVAMKKLGIQSKTTYQRFRDGGRIRFIQPDKKIILYDSASINKYLEKYSTEIFKT